MKIFFLAILFATLTAESAGGQEKPPAWVSLFDGKTLNHWIVAKGSEKVWRVHEGVIDHAGTIDPKDNKGDHLFTRRWYRDFTFKFEWRFSGPSRESEAGPVAGDSGVILRGLLVAEINLWCDPMGSGELHGFRLEKSTPEQLRKACVPLRNTDRPIGQWNAVEVTLIEDRVTVVQNGVTVIEKIELPGWRTRTAPQLPQGGPIGLAHQKFKSLHGEHWTPIQFRNLKIQEYPPGPLM